MKNHSYNKLIAGCVGVFLLAACSAKEPETSVTAAPKPAKSMSSRSGPAPNYVPTNPFLADSVMPIGHVNSAQTTGVNVAGPTGPSEILTQENGGLTYTHMGPGHFGVAISAPYPNGKRVIWSNGQERISKLDYDTMEVLAEYELKNTTLYKNHGGLYTAEEADELIASLDNMPTSRYTGLLAVLKTIPISKEYYGAGLAGVYYLLSSDNVLYVGGKDSILAYADEDPSDPNSPIVLKNEWKKPASVTGGFNSMNMTYDGMLISITDDGWVVLIERDFSKSYTLQLTGAEIAPDWNQFLLDIGHRQGTGSWVRNGPAIDEDGNIFVPSVQHMHKIVWDGSKLSKDPADGAWVEPYSNKGAITYTFEDIIDQTTGKPFAFKDANLGSGSTASLMGFGDEDKFVVITDGDKVMNLVLFWRDEIPADWKQLPNAPSRRIAGMLRADIGRKGVEAVQTEQSVVVGGYGAFVVNNAPTNRPVDKIPVGVYVGMAGNHIDYAPSGVQKFEWDPEAQALKEAWINAEMSSSNGVPLVSNGSNMVYSLGGHDGKWTMDAVDWTTGELAFHYTVDSSRYNTQFSGVLMDQEGRLLHTTLHGLVRYERPGKTE